IFSRLQKQEERKREELFFPRKKMATVVDACVCEITKISEKVRAKSLFLLKKKKTGEKNMEESKKRQNFSSSSSSEMAEGKNDSTMCEATMFLLMDRFAPC
ncbi:hypothetical protein AABB24_023204, partial [Solanum stoloniferum]